MHPYRENSKPDVSRIKLHRKRARMIKLWYNAVLPGLVIGAVCLFSCGFIGMSCASEHETEMMVDARNKRHFDDWQAAVDRREASLNERQAKLDAGEKELASRTRIFEDLVTMSPLLLRGDQESVSKVKQLLERNR